MVQILDNTLRDGGYVNDWNFGREKIKQIFSDLVKSKADIIEVGLLWADEEENLNRTKNSPKTFEKIFKNFNKENSIVIGMIKYGTCPLDLISPASESFLDGIRVYFPKNLLNEAIEFCKGIKSKGYKVLVNPVDITSFEETDLNHLIKLINRLKPYSITMVDTYGVLSYEALEMYYRKLDKGLNAEIRIGFHAHNNINSAIDNAKAFINIPSTRKKIVDGSLNGMGKNAGNAKTEELLQYLKPANT